MDQPYNLYNLEAPFRQFLVAENNSSVTVKNYLSDFKHFAGWYSSVGARSSRPQSNTGGNTPPLQITVENVADYKKYLVDNNFPLKTINRRLSTIRKFCSFCISQGWMKENPAKKIGNISHVRAGLFPPTVQISDAKTRLAEALAKRARLDSTIESKRAAPLQNIMNDFHDYLTTQNLSQSDITDCLDDVREFMEIS